MSFFLRAFFLLFMGRISICFLFFFFQAEDGIRDLIVTGVQTCALPISDQDSTTLARQRPLARRSNAKSWKRSRSVSLTPVGQPRAAREPCRGCARLE